MDNLKLGETPWQEGRDCRTEVKHTDPIDGLVRKVEVLMADAKSGGEAGTACSAALGVVLLSSVLPIQVIQPTPPSLASDLTLHHFLF